MKESIWLIGAGIVYAYGLYALWRKKQLISPFGICLVGFFALCTGLKLRFSDPIGAARTSYEGLGQETEIFMFLSSFAIVVPILFLRRRPPEGMACRYTVTFPLFLYIVCSGAAICEGLASLVRNGGAPGLLLVADSLDGYKDFQIPHISPFAYALGRLSALFLAVEVATSLDTPRRMFEKLSLKGILVFCGLVASMLVGLRGLLLLPMINLAFAYIFTRKIPIVRLAALAVIGMTIFLVLGNIRVKDTDRLFDEKRFGLHTGIPGVDNILAWYASYTVPNLANLSQIIELYPDIHYGSITLAQIVPFYGSVVDTPPTAIEFLDDHKLLPYRGFTFRTIFADYFPDFNWATILVIFFLTAGMVRMHNIAVRSSLALGIYLNFASSIIYMPLKDEFLGVPVITPVLGLMVTILIMKRKGPGTAKLGQWKYRSRN